MKSKLQSEKIWDLLNEDVPEHGFKRQASFLHGLGALFNLFVASDGYAIVARAMFIDHCLEKDRNGLGRFAEFAWNCFKLRICDNEHIFNHLVRHLFQRQLAKRLMHTSELARAYHEETPDAEKNAVEEYISLGYHIGPMVFDTTLRTALLALTREFKNFFYSEKGLILREHFMDAEAVAADVNATMIQNIFRIRIANRVKEKMKLLVKRKHEKLEQVEKIEEEKLKKRNQNLFNPFGQNSPNNNSKNGNRINGLMAALNR